jgi:hypothetical protein
VDEAGIAHVRGEVSRQAVTGDITGEATVTFNGDFVPGPNCNPDDPDNCFEGELSTWGSVVITDENGTWRGNFLFAETFFGGDDRFTFGELVLAGSGGNAGKSIVTDITFSEDGEDDAAVLNGVMLTMAVPAFTTYMTTELCFSEDAVTIAGAFTSTGAIDTYGTTNARFVSGGSASTHRYGLFGEVIFTDETGSFTVQFLGESQDHPESSTAWGHWVIVGGTEAYAELFGHGKVTGAAMENLQCESGFGARLQFRGDMHFN